jgi:hypothetical protein
MDAQDRCRLASGFILPILAKLKNAVSLPKDPQQMEDAVRKWIFGDKSPAGGSAFTASNRRPSQTSPAQSNQPSASSTASAPRTGAYAANIPTKSATPSSVPLSATSSTASTTSTGSVPPPRQSTMWKLILC